MKKILKKILIFPLFFSVLLLTSQHSASALQTLTVPTTPIPSDGEIAGTLATITDTYTYTEPLSSTQTQVTAENTGRWYAWTLDLSSLSPCEDAIPQSINIRARNDLEQEGSPDWGVMTLAVYDGSTVTPLTPERPAISGHSPDPLPFYVGRWSSNITDFGGTPEMGIGIEGPLEGNWPIGSVSSDDQLIIAFGHDAEDGTFGLQSTLESVSVTYDDSACNPTSPGGDGVNPPTAPPKSPKTGDAISMTVALVAAITAIVLILRTASKLKKKH